VETPPPPHAQATAEPESGASKAAVAKDAPAPAAEETVPPEPTRSGAGPSIPEDIRPTVEAVVGPVDEEVVPTPTPSPKSTAHPAESGAGYLDRMFDNIVEYSSDTTLAHLLSTPAKDIMVSEVVWSEPEDTVQSVMAKMQQHNTGYVLIGQDGVLEGLVSNSNILGAVSPYLRPMFAKWRRPEDDATLEIKIKWVMSRPVRTVRPDTPLASMIESMRRYGGRCLPVVDSQAKVLGMITAFDLMLCVLEADKAFSWQGKPPQAPPLLI
jgi:acetoin utilization protein AcuB